MHLRMLVFSIVSAERQHCVIGQDGEQSCDPCEAKDALANVCAAAKCSLGCIRSRLNPPAGTCDVHQGTQSSAWDNPVHEGEFNGWKTCQDHAFTAGCSSRCEVIDEQYVQQHALLLEAESYAARLMPEKDVGDDTDDGPELVPWLRSACLGHSVPHWMVSELQENHREITVEREPRCLRDELPSVVAGVTPPEPPSYEGPAVPVQRVRVADLRAAELPAAAFWQRYYREGLPVVLEGGLSPSWLKSEAAEVGACCREAQAERVATYGTSCRGCEPHGGDWNIDEKVQLCGDRCGVLAATAIGVGLDGEVRERSMLAAQSQPELPIHAVLDFSDVAQLQVGLVNEQARGFGFASWLRDRGFVLLTREGGEFGTPAHFDQGCDGVLAVQYAGRKLWSLWAPWDLPGDIPAHTRFETELTPGDVLVYPPAMFHATRTIEGDSVAAAFDIRCALIPCRCVPYCRICSRRLPSLAHHRIPPYGALLRDQSLWATPFGFERCARGRDGWREQSRALDLALEKVALMALNEALVQDGVDTHVQAWLRSACPGAPPAPAWMLEELRASHAKITIPQEPRCLRQDDVPSVAGATPPEPPDYMGDARQISRVRVGDLTAAELWRRFFRAGLPVVLEGGMDAGLVEQQAATLGECCRAVHAELARKHGARCLACAPHDGATL